MYLKTLLFGIICGFVFTNKITNAATNQYHGTKIGSLTELHHGVSGEVYAVDSRTLFLKNFNYDGGAPAAYFYVGNTRRPSNNGAFRLRDETGSVEQLKKYRSKDITLTLPEGKTLRDVKWFAVWCDEFSVNFGDVTIPKNLDYPRPHKINALNGVHGVSSDNIVVVDAQTLLIPNFSYDGEAPDAKFWVGRGPKPSPQGIRIPDENGKENPLRRYDKKTIVLTLPGDLTVFDIGHFGIWCEAFTVDFGHIRMPESVNVPPSLRMLGISPQSKLNCEVLYDDIAFEVRWAVAGESIVVQLVAKLDDGEYMSFGISPNVVKTEMIGADVAVAWVDKETGKGYAYDYHLEDKSQCSGTRGSCPDTRIMENTNSIRLLNAAMVNGYSIVTYQRPLKASDKLDLPIFVNGSQAIAWAVGPLNQRKEVSYHSKFTKGDRLIDFGRQPFWNCPSPDGDRQSYDDEEPEVYYNRQPQTPGIVNRFDSVVEETAAATTKRPRRPATPRPAAKKGAWEIPPIQCYEPEDGVFYAQMGPTGGKHGYPAITGHVGWGISWYINGLLIPEINVVRGKQYTFVVEGGYDPEIPAKYHPFYITDDSVGGYEHKTDEEKAKIKIFAGVEFRGRNRTPTPTGTGRLCNWTPDPDGPAADDYTSFGAYQRSLTLKCDAGEPGVINWTPDDNTPDTVFYHCFTHRYLGWRINVLDSCDDAADESEIDEVFAEPDAEGFEAQASIRHESKINPNNIFGNTDKGNVNIYLPGPSTSGPLNIAKDSDISQLITEGIRAAEELEESIMQRERVKLNQTMSLNLQETTEPEERAKLPGGIRVAYDSQIVPHPQSGLPMFLRPPQGYKNNGPMFRPVKVAYRRPISYERRPVVRPARPVILPQQSMLVSHYKKPVSALMRPFVNKKPVPIQSIASVLLLGQPTEISSHLYSTPPSVNIQKPTNSQYLDFQSSYINNKDHPLLFPQKEKKQSAVPQYYEKPVLQKSKLPFPTKKVEYRPTLNNNNGFQPDSVVVESGFRPIIRRGDDETEGAEFDENQNRRRDDSVADEIDEAISSDALLINREPQANKQFEPMFIPSPLDNVNKGGKQAVINHKEEHLTGDLIEMEVEDGEDKMAVAAERQDTYYLPPINKRPGQVYPEGTVVAYDGKAVLDTSLVNSAPPSIGSQIYADVSRTEQLIRNTPQFGPFRGEIPPLGPNFNPRDSIQINRDPSPVTEYLNPLGKSKNPELLHSSRPISTKLTLHRTDNSRTKRAAHHTADHHGDDHDQYDRDHKHDTSKAPALHYLTHLAFISSITVALFLNY